MALRAGLNDNIRPTPSVALGAYEVTPLEIAGAYTMFANQGMLVRPTTVAMVRARDGSVLYRHEPDARPALDPRVTYLMVNMMQEVLIGFDDNRDLNLEGARSALPIWADFMKRASQLRPYRGAHDFKRPGGVTSVKVCAGTGELAGANCPSARPEVFVAGTEPLVECDLHGHVLAADRDIP